MGIEVGTVSGAIGSLGEKEGFGLGLSDAFRSSSMVGVAAQEKALVPFRLNGKALAPCFKSNLTMDVCPFADASIRGVVPHSLVAFTLAPWLIRTRTACVWPRLQAS